MIMNTIIIINNLNYDNARPNMVSPYQNRTSLSHNIFYFLLLEFKLSSINCNKCHPKHEICIRSLNLLPSYATDFFPQQK